MKSAQTVPAKTAETGCRIGRRLDFLLDQRVGPVTVPPQSGAGPDVDSNSRDALVTSATVPTPLDGAAQGEDLADLIGAKRDSSGQWTLPFYGVDASGGPIVEILTVAEWSARRQQAARPMAAQNDARKNVLREKQLQRHVRMYLGCAPYGKGFNNPRYDNDQFAEKLREAYGEAAFKAAVAAQQECA